MTGLVVTTKHHMCDDEMEYLSAHNINIILNSMPSKHN